MRMAKARHIAGERPVKGSGFICRTSMNSSAPPLRPGDRHPLCRARWYRRFKLSLLDQVETMVGRGIIGRARRSCAGSGAPSWGSCRVDETNVKIKSRWTDPPRMRTRKSIDDVRSPVHSDMRDRGLPANPVSGGIHDDGLITNADGKCRRNAGWMPARRHSATIMPKRAGISCCPSSRCGVQRRIQMFVTEH